MEALEDTLEVGCLHVGLIAVRNIKPAKHGGMGDFFGLTPQDNPYCKVTLGGHEFTSGVGVRTTVGHAFNREQMFFPVKVPLSCVVGVSGDQQQGWNETPTAGSRVRGGSGGGLNQEAEKACTAIGGRCLKSYGGTGVRGKGAGPGADGGGGEGVVCGSSLLQAAAAADAAAAYEVWSRLTLRAQVLHREDASAASKEETRRPTTPAGERSDTHKTTGSSSNSTKAMEIRGSANGGDRVLGECSLNLVEVVSGRAPHIEEWVPLDSGGDLRLSLDYDSIGTAPAPGDSVVLLCLSNRLDFFPLPVWDTAADLGRPGSPSWLWARDASQRRLLGAGGGGRGGAGGFRVEEAGDDFFLISYATPEGWRCAVEVHRFLVYPDPTVPRRWTLSDVRDYAIATPAAAAVHGAVLRAGQQESLLAGGRVLALDVAQGVSWTAARWWGGGLERVRNDVWFALGLTDDGSSAKPEEREQGNGAEEQEQAGETDDDQDGTESDTELYHHHRQLPVLPSTTSETGVGGLAEGGARSNPSFAAGTEAPSSRNGHGGGGDGDGGGLSSAGSTTPQGPSAAQAAATSPSGMDRKPMTATGLVAGPPGPSQPQQPLQHLCPITRCPLEDPAVAADGYTYERAAIERWLSEHDTSPVTGKVLETKVVFKNWSLVSSAPVSPVAQGTTPGT